MKISQSAFHVANKKKRNLNQNILWKKQAKFEKVVKSTVQSSYIRQE